MIEIARAAQLSTVIATTMVVCRRRLAPTDGEGGLHHGRRLSKRRHGVMG